MKSLDEFRSYYDTALRPELEKLEHRRKSVLTNLVLANAGIVALSVALAAALAAAGAAGGSLVFPVLLGLAGIGGASAWLTRGFRSDFKASIIQPIIAFVDPELTYSPDACIGQQEFLQSSIFQHSIDRYHGEDLIAGKIDKTAIRFSEVHAEYKTTTTDSKGRRQTHWHTIFKGLFFVADFNKNFAGRTVVLPDQAERLLGRLGQKLQSISIGRDALVKLEDPEFEKAFVVYGSDQTEARYVLSTSLMRRLLDFRHKVKVPIHASFVNANLYLALGTRKNLFEPRLLRTLLDFSLVEGYLEDLLMAVGIVEDLNLNTRIWTKE